MVKKVTTEGREYFQCEECLLLYEDKEWAERCNAWCKKFPSCNLEITAHAIKER